MKNFHQLLKKAFLLVAEKSSDEQRMLSAIPGKEPYWNHLNSWYKYAVLLGIKEQTTLLSGVLHDILEDSDVTVAQLEEMFGKEVREIVELVTKQSPQSYEKVSVGQFYDKIINYSNQEIAKKAMIIKVFDRIDNLIGLSFVDKPDLFTAYEEECNTYVFKMATKVGLEQYLQNALDIAKLRYQR